MKVIAEFNPQAWVRDQAIDVDAEGPRGWDATKYASQNLEYVKRMLARRPDGYEVLDNDDVFQNDPDAPEWVRNWSGPFSIYLTIDDMPIAYTTIEEATAALEEANGRYRVALQDSQRHTLMLLALAARKAFPSATAIILGQSDQGDHADFDEIEVPDADADQDEHYQEKQDAFTDEHGPTVWNLATSGWTEWQTFCDPEHNVRWSWRLLIDPVLEYHGDFMRHITDRQKEQG